MNSFISSFRPIICAIFAIAVIEAAVYFIVRPNPVQRSNYLGYNYLEPEKFFKGLIYEKLKEFGDAPADVIQVGDSTGLHNIIPKVVEKYLGGLKYVNLSCCAPTGFDGYYTIAQWALDHDPDAKALVLYTSLNDLPKTGEITFGDQVGGATNLHDTFGAPWSGLWPPSMALRAKATAAVFSLGGLLSPDVSELDQNGTSILARQWLDAHAGWWPELDASYTANNPKSILNQLCGGSDTYGLDLGPSVPKSSFYATSVFGRPRFYPTEVFERFADLAAKHNAKLVIAFQPHPCGQLYEPSLKILQSSLSEVMRKHANVAAVVPEQIFEHWPASEFITQDHLRAGYEVAASERLGKHLAAALELPAAQVAPDHDYATDSDASTPASWSLDPGTQPSFMIGVTLAPVAGPSPTIEVTPHPPAPRYYFETRIPQIEPGKPYVYSLIVKPEGIDGISFGLRDLKLPGQLGQSTCDFKQGSASRTQQAFDTNVEQLADGWWRCWVSVLLCDSRAIAGVDVLSPQAAAVDGKKPRLLIRDMQVQPGWRLVPESGPRLPPIIPYGQRCS